MPPAPRVGTAALHEEMRRRISGFPAAQRYDRKFYNENFWAAFLTWEHAARRRSSFLGDYLPWQQVALTEMAAEDDDVHDDREAQEEVAADVPYDEDAHFEAEAMARSVADENTMWSGMDAVLRLTRRRRSSRQTYHLSDHCPRGRPCQPPWLAWS